MIFNAFALLMVITLSFSSAPAGRWWSAFVFIVVVTIWLNIFAVINPRFLAYGPKEYLRESELEHERKMAGK